MRIALIADSHLSARSPECVANWRVAARAVERLAPDLTVHLGDITLDGQTHAEELGFAARLVQQWPTTMRCVPGNHDLGDGSGETPLDDRLLGAYADAFGADRWALRAGDWLLMGINAQLLGSGSEQERAQWHWMEAQVSDASREHAHTALFLHRPVWRPPSDEPARPGRYVAGVAARRLLEGALQSTLRLVVSGHTHQYLDVTVRGVRHVWMPSSAFVLPDTMQTRAGEKLVGIGVLELGGEAAQFDLWCPDGMARHDLSTLPFFQTMTDGQKKTDPRGSV
ncbi:metallophosphoesterase family protein [Hydrogenophaga sp.]|uniref:metallophosphoesterase family protein n=1 Tax=Hydrogenophaga sp. TaxID=1904254 RepID=UPI002FC65A34